MHVFVQPVVSDERLPASVDVVVIGGGIAGVTAAYALAKKDLSVALVEKGVIAGEQSSRNWGWCRQQHRDLRELPLAMKSLELWGELSRELSAETGFRRTGLLYVTTRPADFAEWEGWTLAAREHQMHSRVLTSCRGQGHDAGQHAGLDRRRPFADRRPSRAVAGRAGHRRGRAPAGCHLASELRRARPRPRSRQGRGRHHRARHHPYASRALRRRRVERLVLSPPWPPLAAGQRALNLVRHQGSPRRHRWRPVDARRHHSPPARRRLHGGAGRARPGRTDAAGPAPCPAVLADAQEALGGRDARHRPLVFRRPRVLRALVIRSGPRPSSAIARSIPPPIPSWSSRA